MIGKNWINKTDLEILLSSMKNSVPVLNQLHKKICPKCFKTTKPTKMISFNRNFISNILAK